VPTDIRPAATLRRRSAAINLWLRASARLPLACGVRATPWNNFTSLPLWVVDTGCRAERAQTSKRGPRKTKRGAMHGRGTPSAALVPPSFTLCRLAQESKRVN